ncbi:MAG: endonuclease MutS2, partial [Bacteroidales bacterium]|nr:endonuclease MutS2 [Bacteroidales bacterium]
MNLEQKLGFDKVRTMVSVKCATDYARTRVEEEEFISDPDDILMRLCLTDEMRLICLFEDSFPVSGYIDTKPFLTPLSAEYSWIELQSLAKLRTSQDTLRGVLTFFRGCKDDLYPNLRAIASSVNYFPEVSRRINAILDRNNEVKDSASPELQQIRKSLKEKSASISKRIATILKQAQMDGLVEEGVSVAVRDGRTLIPVSAANKKRLPGLVYDESATGKTAFIEPFEVVELENQVRELQFEEQREIVRILTEFTDFLRPYIPELCAASDFLGEMDFIRAKARVAVDMIAGLPVLSTDGGMTFRKARHPLLEATLRRERKEIVPLTMSLTKEKHILLISGPNAGGKSVCLKTVGLLQYMFQWGMLIPTSEISELLVFDEIFIDIGDDQSLENDLSTYSSHLANLRDILDRSTKNSLVLIDEFGSGTEPAAGGAIAEAVLSELDRRGTYGVITTHYTNLKLYASGSTGVINGAMLFDAAAIQPMFKLEQGLPGNSFAFELARKMGLPESLVHDA